MKRIVAIAALALACGASLAVAEAPAASPKATLLDQELASVDLVRRSPVSLKQFRNDIARLESATGKKLGIDDRKQYLDLQINDILFVQYCEREKISVTDAEMVQATNSIKQQVMASAQQTPGAVDAATLNAWSMTGTISDEAFFAILGRMGVQTADMKNYVRKRLLLQKFMASRKDQFQKVQPPSYDEIKAFHEKNRGQFFRPETVKLSLIFFDARNADEAGKAKLKAKADEIFEKVRNNPVAFDEMVLRYLDGNSGYVAEPAYMFAKTPQFQAMMGPNFYAAAFGLKQNQVSALIEGPSGWHILKLVESYPEKTLELSDQVSVTEKGTVLEYLKQNLYNQKVNKAMEDTLNDLVKEMRAKAKIKIREDLLAW